MKNIEASMLALALLLMLSVASVSASANLAFGGKSGDWVEYNVQQSFSLTGDQMERMDFLNVAGTEVTVQATVYMGSLPLNKTAMIDMTSQDARDDFSMLLFSARVYFIPGGLGVNDSVYLGEQFGQINITGETTRNYAGADRRVIYANFTQSPNIYFLYWDKQTGVLTEGIKILGSASSDVLLTSTSMWGTQLWLILWIIIIIVIALGVLSSRKSIMKKLRGKRDAQISLTKMTLFQSLSKRKS